MNSPTFAHPAKIAGILFILEMVLEVLVVDPFSTKPHSERKIE